MSRRSQLWVLVQSGVGVRCICDRGCRCWCNLAHERYLRSQ
ncbi:MULTISPECIES: hypothetical protein [Nostocaceae]|nr:MULTISPECIES: hypothetical protein [Nostocaceae]